MQNEVFDINLKILRFFWLILVTVSPSFSVLYSWSLSVRYSALQSTSYNDFVLHCSFNLRERDTLEDRGIDGMIILRWIFRKLDGMDGLE